ncbi:MAG: phage tail sheath C-terminal domain-containing protein, partial [Methylococcales bacterium]|nr:phage tail sheath C-terminal domain-containing protein [Methylococcales bacterium]
VEDFVDKAVTVKNTLSTDAKLSLEDRLKALLGTYNAVAADASADDIKNVLQPLTEYMVDIVKAIKTRNDIAPAASSSRFKLKDDISKYITSSNINAVLKTLATHHKFLADLGEDTINLLNLPADKADVDVVCEFLGLTDSSALLASVTANDVSSAYTSANTAKLRGSVAIGPTLSAVNEAIAFFHFLEASQNNYEKTLNEALLASFGSYKDLVTKAADALNLLPPSGAIAGVYAAVDRDRGVWKAPANVSLNAVISPAVKISQEQQGEYNVDVNAGKSINIIRSFTGKGTLVWGARTLAGNDNEWRYISVRRFFNFVEESVKKATGQFVFEPNDANTWVKVQAMIENFLITLWRQGALQGIKPEHAFYVAVGLGKTMTPLDILEGRMIIEIGMAVVRPAEFIILKFSHKMAES